MSLEEQYEFLRVQIESLNQHTREQSLVLDKQIELAQIRAKEQHDTADRYMEMIDKQTGQINTLYHIVFQHEKRLGKHKERLDDIDGGKGELDS